MTTITNLEDEILAVDEFIAKIQSEPRMHWRLRGEGHDKFKSQYLQLRKRIANFGVDGSSPDTVSDQFSASIEASGRLVRAWEKATN